MNTNILYFFFHLTQHHPWLAQAATFFSQWMVYLVPLAVVMYMFVTERRPVKKSIYLVVTVALAVLITDYFFKGLFEVARPFTTLGFTPIITEAGFSFPSGHASFAGALFAATSLVISRHRWFDGVIGILCVLIALSRMMLGVHYPTDIIAGFFWGFLFAYGVYTILKKYL